MSQIGEREFRDAIIGTKKDAKLVAAAKNDRMNAPETLYREFSKLAVERQRDLIISLCGDYFVASQWKIAFPLNNTPAAALPHAVAAAARALFFTRDETCVVETIRCMRFYQESPFLKQIATILGEAVEIAGPEGCAVARILTSPELFGMIRQMDSELPSTERTLETIARTALYTKDFTTSMAVAKFLIARRHSPALPEISTIVENSIFLARDRKSVSEILQGLNAGAIDVVIQRHTGNKNAIASIRDIATKTRNADAIRKHLLTYLQ
jgi:hypothetical protein